MLAQIVSKGVSAVVFDKILKAFDPLIQLIQGIAYPLAYCAIGLGVILMILDQRHRGMQLIRSAVIGYLLMQWLPAIMVLLRDIGQAMRQ